MKKSETCFTEGVDKSTEFSLYHFSNRASAWAYYNDQATGLPDFLDHPVKENRGRVSISSETRPVYVQSIYVPSILCLGLEIRTVELWGSDECRCSDHSVDWIWFDLDRRSAITFRHPGMCLAFKVIW